MWSEQSQVPGPFRPLQAGPPRLLYSILQEGPRHSALLLYQVRQAAAQQGDLQEHQAVERRESVEGRASRQ